MRPLSFGLSISGGGIPRFVAELARALRKQNPRSLTIFGPATICRLYQSERPQDFIEFHPIPRVWGLNQWKFALLSWWHLGPLGPLRANIKHLHAASFAIPDVFTVHGLYVCVWLANPKRGLVAKLQFALLCALERRMLRRSRTVAFVSHANMEYVRNVLGIWRPEAFHVIKPGVDCDKFSDFLRTDLLANRAKFFPELDSKARWLLFVGHEYQNKGLPKILNALAAAQNLHLNWKLLIFGNDPVVRPTLNGVLEKLGSHVVFMESDQKLPQAFGLSDILVQDSTAEGFPLVLLEAMAAGCIPFVTRFPGTSDAIVEGETGFLHADSAQLAQAALLTPDSNLNACRPKARSHALEHTWARTARSYERLYASLDDSSA